MKTSSAKAKGRRCSQEVKELILSSFKGELKPDDIIVTSSGETGVDLKLSPLAQELFPFAVECKNVEKLNIWEALKQTESHLKDGSEVIPALFFKRNRTGLYAALPAEVFVRLVAYASWGLSSEEE